MAMPALDTHKAVKSLRSAGFDDAQAEAVVEQINDAVIENVATKTDIERLATKDELRDSLAGLATKTDLEQCATKADLERFATKEALREEVAKLATKEDLEQFATKADLGRFATKDELREEVAKLATKEDLEQYATKQELDNAIEKLELRLTVDLEKHATRCVRSFVAVAAAMVGLTVGLTKALDFLVG